MLIKMIARFGLLFAFGAMLHLLAGDLRSLDAYSDIWTYPEVGAGIVEHLGAVLMAFGAGHYAQQLKAAGGDIVDAQTLARVQRL